MLLKKTSVKMPEEKNATSKNARGNTFVKSIAQADLSRNFSLLCDFLFTKE